MYRLSLGILFLFIGLNEATAQSSVVYSSFGPGDSFAPGGYILAAPGPQSCAPPSNPWCNDTDLATSFTMSKAARLDKIELPINLTTHTTSPANSLDIWLMADNSGKPGPVIETLHVNGAMGQWPNSTKFVTVGSSARPALLAGVKYWIGASVPSTDTVAIWLSSLTQGIDGVATRNDLGSWTVGSRLTQPFAPALRVTGTETTATPTPQPTPTPCLTPNAPSGVTSSVSGTTVTLNWSGSSSVTSYILEAGSRPAQSDLVVIDIGNANVSYTASGVSAGSYYVRIKARNSCGTSLASNEVQVIVGPSVPTPTSKHTVFLLHGLGQGPENLASFSHSLQDALGSTFRVDASFDFSKATKQAGPLCSYTPADGAREFAGHIADYVSAHPDHGDFAFVGYSLGGLIARDLIVNNYLGALSDKRRVPVLITLGTPNLGYPFIGADDVFVCAGLVTAMSSDFKNPDASQANCSLLGERCVLIEDRASQQKATISRYLYDLNVGWGLNSFPFGPDTWFAASGSACAGPGRPPLFSLGCSSANPKNDGVVCQQSALLSWPLANGPTDKSFDGSNYVHTHDPIARGVLGCDTSSPSFGDLSNPGPDLIKKIVTVITARMR